MKILLTQIENIDTQPECVFERQLTLARREIEFEVHFETMAASVYVNCVHLLCAYKQGETKI